MIIEYFLGKNSTILPMIAIFSDIFYVLYNMYKLKDYSHLKLTQRNFYCDPFLFKDLKLGQTSRILHAKQ